MLAISTRTSLTVAIVLLLSEGCSQLSPAATGEPGTEQPQQTSAQVASLAPTASPTNQPPASATSVPLVADARDRCNALNVPKLFPMPPGTELTAAFATDSAGYDSWHSDLEKTVGGGEGFDPNPATEAPTSSDPVYLCYWDGPFGSRGPDLPNVTRMVMAITPDGVVHIVAQGNSGIPVIEPPAFDSTN